MAEESELVGEGDQAFGGCVRVCEWKYVVKSNQRYCLD